MNETFESVATKGISLQEVYDRANEVQSLCADYNIVDCTTRNIHYDPVFNGLSFTDDNGDKYKLALTPYALSQLCQKLGVPIRYVQKCIESGQPDLAADNLNAWLDDYHKNLFIRGYDNSARGVLSDKYATCDAPDILDVLTDVFPEKSYKVKGALFNFERMHLRVVQKKMLKIAGEDLFAGVQIDSSDVGRSTLIVRFFLYKQVCTNGLIISHDMGIIFSQRHIGLTADEFRSDLSANLKRIPDVATATMEMIKNAQTYSVDYNKWGETQQNRWSGRIRALTRLPDDAINNVVQLMYNNYEVNAWGLVNALTEQAQEYTLERRIELENVAGRILVEPVTIAA